MNDGTNTEATTMGTTADKAKAIRDELKVRYGWTGRQVSVRAELYSMGSTIRVVAKDPRVSLSKVREVAEQHEVIHRDHMSGEILSGCNLFVDCKYDHNCTESLWAYAERELVALAKANEPGHVCGLAVVLVDDDEWHVTKPDGDEARCRNAAVAARVIVESLCDAGRGAELQKAVAGMAA